MQTPDFIDWLLQSDLPSIRYLTLTRLLNQPQTDQSVQASRRAIMETGPVPVMLAKQAENGAWQGDKSYYTPKYVSAHWSMMLLDELAADGQDPRIQRGLDFMLADSQKKIEDHIEQGWYGWSCFWANILHYAAHCGRTEDPRLRPIIDYLVRDLAEGRCACDINADLPCAWGAARTLWALAALPVRSPAVETAIERGLTFLLDSYHLTEADYPSSNRPSALWWKLNFPLFYQTDILFVLRVVAELGALDHPGARPALEWLANLRKPDGRWKGASPFRSRTWAGVAGSQDVDRWISLHAAVILQLAGRFSNVSME
jgi:hypothetical protein